jgi:hypothetical protein
MKAWASSKTIWLGVSTLLTAVGSPLSNGVGWREGVIAAIGAANILLRTQAFQPVGRRVRRGCAQRTFDRVYGARIDSVSRWTPVVGFRFGSPSSTALISIRDARAKAAA